MKKTICIILALAMFVMSLTACQQTTTFTETTTSNRTEGEVTTSGGKVNTNVSESTGSGALDAVSTKTGTIGSVSKDGWVSNVNTLSAEEMDVAFPNRKGIKGEVRVFTPFPDDEEFKQAVEQMKTVYPKVTKVTVLTASNLARNEKLLSLITSGQSPDWVYSTYQDYPLRAAKGLTIPIDDYIYDHPALSDALMNNNCSYNGKKYCVVIEVPIYVLFFNTAMFERAGEKTPAKYFEEGNWTWATLRRVAKKMTDSQNGIYGLAMEDDWIFPLSVGEDVIKISNGKPKLNLRGNQAYIDAHQVFIDMINVDKSTNPTHWTAVESFSNGKAAMCYTAVSHKDIFFEPAGMKTYDYTVFPKENSDANYYSPAGGLNGGFSIAKGSKNIEGGMAFGELYMNIEMKKGNMTAEPKAYELARKANIRRLSPLFYGYGLESMYLQDFCGWARTGSKDLNTLIEENAPLMEAKLKEYS